MNNMVAQAIAMSMLISPQSYSTEYYKPDQVRKLGLGQLEHEPLLIYYTVCHLNRSLNQSAYKFT